MFKKINKVVSILLSISIVAAGVCMISQCLSIYNSGDKPYTRAAVAEAFAEIKVPIIIFASLFVASIILDLIMPFEESKKIMSPYKPFVINAINKKWDIASLNDPMITKEKNKRRLLNIISLVLIGLGFLVFGIYALNPQNYHQSQINQSMIKAMTVFCICIIIPFIFRLICVYINEKSLKTEISIAQKLTKVAQKNNTPIEEKGNTTALNVVKGAVIIASIAIILFGLFSGGTADVLTKAINICTECIGLG